MKKLQAVLAMTVLSVSAACEAPGEEVAPAEGEAVVEEAAAETSGTPATEEEMIASALSAGPADVTDNATVVDGEGNVLREGSNGWTCITETAAMGPMCNDAVWMEALGGIGEGTPFPTGKLGVSYMLAGEGGAPGVSNLDPAASEPSEDNMWIKEGPHMMLILPDSSVYADISNDTSDPVYVMWKDTPFAHLMVRLEGAE